MWKCAGAPDRIPTGIAMSGDNNMLSLRDKHPQLASPNPSTTLVMGGAVGTVADVVDTVGDGPGRAEWW